MGNDLKQKILVQNGIISETDGKPKPTVANCPRCSLVNCIDHKFCSNCSYPLTPSAFDEIKAVEDMKLRNLEQKYEQDIMSVREQMNTLFNVLQELRDQKDINIIATTLYRSGHIKIHKKK